MYLNLFPAVQLQIEKKTHRSIIGINKIMQLCLFITNSKILELSTLNPLVFKYSLFLNLIVGTRKLMMRSLVSVWLSYPQLTIELLVATRA